MLANSIALISVAVMLGIEAYKASDRLPRVILAALAMIFALSGALIQPITEVSPRIGGFITGVFSEPSSWFVLAVGLFFVLRRYWQEKYDPLTMDQLAARGFLVDGSARLDRLEARVTELKQAMEAPKLVRNEAELERRVKELGESVDLANRRIVSVDQHVKNEFEGMAARIGEEAEKSRRSFYALQVRERLEELSREIEEDAAILYDRLQAGETYDKAAWDKWENVHHMWWQRLNAWIELAKWYAANVQRRTLEFPDAAYAGEWTVAESQFPDAEAVRKFKRHRIINGQWNEVRPSVKEGLDLVAFVGVSDKELRRGQAPG